MDLKAICDYSLSEVETMGITVKKGIHVVRGNGDSIATGRIITHINGVEVNTVFDYEYELLKYSKNDTITITTSDSYGTVVKQENVRLK